MIQHLLASPLFDPDTLYAFSLSWLHPDSVHYPFDHMHGGLIPTHQDGQIVPELGPIVNDYIPESPLVGLDMSIESLFTCSSDPLTIEPIRTSSVASGDSSDGSPQSTSDVIIISYDEDIKEIEIVDLTSEDDEDPKMDIEIMDLTSNSD
ncbi:hypothetical protein AHAS_Ahas03G0215200 [Arachis hypogaea]